MSHGTTIEDHAADEVTLAVDSPSLRVEILRLADGRGIDWQRCPVVDRVFVVSEGSGHAWRSHGRDEIREEIRGGDVVFLKRMMWHRITAAPGGKLVGALVTAAPAAVEVRR